MLGRPLGLGHPRIRTKLGPPHLVKPGSRMSLAEEQCLAGQRRRFLIDSGLCQIDCCECDSIVEPLPNSEPV